MAKMAEMAKTVISISRSARGAAGPEDGEPWQTGVRGRPAKRCDCGMWKRLSSEIGDCPRASFTLIDFSRVFLKQPLILYVTEVM